MPRIADHTDTALTHATPPSLDPCRRVHDAAAYSALWSIMNAELAQSILDTGMWDDLPVTPVQRQVAYDLIISTAPNGPRQVQLEEA